MMMDPPILFPEVPQLTPQQKFRLSKEAQIKEAISKRDYEALARLAKSKSGLLSDSLRRQAWPILLGCNADIRVDPNWAAIAPHQDEEQARLDVERSFIFYPPSNEIFGYWLVVILLIKFRSHRSVTKPAPHKKERAARRHYSSPAAAPQTIIFPRLS
ncbi:hypothetical protein V1525DRAFT_12678 [Lipomyces kononenkoae]|uniref:Uncharacterized protein n=1 Tax=Lipomyces kononenkoae TaxID=34357 RepID=A0ACC3T6T4_LIPKO